MDTIIRDYRQFSILEKVFNKKEKRFSSIVSARNPYGLYADLFNSPEKYPETKLSTENQTEFYKVFGVKGKKGGAKRITGYVSPLSINKNTDDIQLYKLFFSKAYMTTSTVPPEIIVGDPGTISTETFLQIGPFECKENALNCLNYIKTKFFRALLFYNRHSLNISRESFDLIPLLSFDKEWDDNSLYKRYDLSDDEVRFIEENIMPME